MSTLCTVGIGWNSCSPLASHRELNFKNVGAAYMRLRPEKWFFANWKQKPNDNFRAQNPLRGARGWFRPERDECKWRSLRVSGAWTSDGRIRLWENKTPFTVRITKSTESRRDPTWHGILCGSGRINKGGIDESAATEPDTKKESIPTFFFFFFSIVSWELREKELIYHSGGAL